MSLRRGTAKRGLEVGGSHPITPVRANPQRPIATLWMRQQRLARPGRCQDARSMSIFRDSARTFTPDSSCDLNEGAVGRNLDHFTKPRHRCQASGIGFGSKCVRQKSR